MNLRIRGPHGQSVLKDLDEDITVDGLLQRISAETHLGPEALELLTGFPPTKVQLPEDGSIVAKEAFKIQNNDLITVQKGMESSKEPQEEKQTKGVNTSSSAVMSSLSEDEQLARAIAASLGEEVDVAPTTGTLERKKAGFEALPSGQAVARRIVADDNSCLFSAVGYVTGRGRGGASELRSVVAQAVVQDPIQWNEVVLGREPSEYAAWILDMSKWGGAIELSILSQQLAVEICAFDIQTQRVDIYGEHQEYSHRVMVVYDGLHYDALALAAYVGAPESQDITRFSVNSQLMKDVMNGAASLVSRYNEARQFTDTNKFTLRCNICNQGLVGEKGALLHAQETGHQNFSEY